MIKVRIRVSSETRDFAVVVCAENLQRAAQSVNERYPGSAIEIEFPIEPEQFFAGDPTTANNRPRGRGGGPTKEGVVVITELVPTFP